jgi:hypothetical protein
MEGAMSDPYGFRALIESADNEQLQKYKAELEAGVDAGREEEIRDWFALVEIRRRRRKARIKREERQGRLANLPRPDLLN